MHVRDNHAYRLDCIPHAAVPTHLPTYLPNYLPIYLPACLPIYLPTRLPTCLYLPTYPTYLPACLPTYLPTYLATNLPEVHTHNIHPYTHASKCLCRHAVPCQLMCFAMIGSPTLLALPCFALTYMLAVPAPCSPTAPNLRWQTLQPVKLRSRRAKGACKKR